MPGLNVKYNKRTSSRIRLRTESHAMSWISTVHYGPDVVLQCMNKLLEKTLLPHWLVVIWTFVPRMPFNDIFMASYVNQWFEKASSWMSSVKMQNTGLTLDWILTLKLLRISGSFGELATYPKNQSVNFPPHPPKKSLRTKDRNRR